MRFWGDERAQALQVGAVLLFGFLVVGLAIYQVSVVPEQNRQVEFDAYQDAAGDMADLRGDVLASAGRDVTTSTTVTTGARYPPRAVFVNPPPGTGSLRLGDPTTVTIENAAAVDSEDPNTRRYWNGTPRSFETKPVRFAPDYSDFEGPSIVVTGESSFRDAGDRIVPAGGQTLLSGDRLQLIAIGGEMDADGLETRVTTDPVSPAERTVVVEGAGTEDIVVEIAPGADPAAWNATFGERLLDRADVLSVEARTDTVAVTLDGDRSYRLRLGKVALRERGDLADAEDPGAAYVVARSDAASTIAQGSNRTLRVEVRDAFDNPAAEEDVEFALTRGSGSLTRTDAVTTEEGEASTTFEPSTGFTGEAEVVATVPDADAGVDETVFTVNVVDPAGGGGDGSTGSELNPNESARIVFSGATIQNGGDRTAVLTFDNNGEETREMRSARINFYYVGSTQPNRDPTRATVSDPARPEELVIGGGFVEFTDSIEIPADGRDVTLSFEGQSGAVDVRDGDFFILSVTYENGESATYFVAPSE